MFSRHSALDERVAAGAGTALQRAGALRLGVRQGWQLLQLGHFRHTRAQLDAVLVALTGSPLPTSTCVVQHAGVHRLYRIAADQYWIVTPELSLLDALALAVAPEVASLTPLSHARVRIALEGPAVAALLAKVVSVDLRPSAFASGTFTQTGLHHVGVLLERLGPTQFELYALRTYAASIWDWLIDAALPFGYEVDPA